MRNFDADMPATKDHLAELARANGIDPMYVTDAPERTAEAVWHVLPEGEDRDWLEEAFGPFAD